jgi:hypothetical protein
MTDTGVTPPAPVPTDGESLLERVEQKIEEVIHGAEHDAEVVAPDVKTVATDAGDVADALDPAADSVVAEVEGVVDDGVAAVDRSARVGPATVDSDVQQGNRVTVAGALTPDNPVKILTDKIKAHYDALTPLIADVRARLDDIEAELNKVRVGL